MVSSIITQNYLTFNAGTTGLFHSNQEPLELLKFTGHALNLFPDFGDLDLPQASSYSHRGLCSTCLALSNFLSWHPGLENQSSLILIASSESPGGG